MNSALLVGINAYPQQQLAGCVPDVEDVATYLVSERGYAHDSVVPLHDSRATKAAIVGWLRKLVSASVPGDHVLFHFSGHGTLMPSADVDATDSLEEVLCPVDFDWSPDTTLSEYQLRGILATVPAGVSLTIVVDAGHSGELERLLPRETDRSRFMRPPSDVLWRLANRRRVVRRFRSLSQGNVAIVAACAATETAADTRFAGWANGAFTHHWLRELGRPHEGQPTRLNELVSRVTRPLAPYNMHPVVSGPAELLEAPFLGDARAPQAATVDGGGNGHGGNGHGVTGMREPREMRGEAGRALRV